MNGLRPDPTNAADLARRRVVYAEQAGSRHGDGMAIRIFEEFPARFTALVHLAAGSSLPADPARRGFEILVVDGEVDLGGGRLHRHGYARGPTGPGPATVAADNSILFVKRGHIPAEDRREIVHQPGPADWKDRQEGQLRTLALHHHTGIAVSLMRYLPGTAAVVRRRLGGEEILVLDGTLLDERSAYPRGTWIRNPPGSLHQPYSVEGCLIYLQTGHLPII
jgi:hypothetical protein